MYENNENVPVQCKDCSYTHNLLMSEKSNSSAQSIELFSQLLEISPCAVMMVNLEGLIILCSKRAAEMYGFSSIQEMVGTSALELIMPEDHNRAIDNVSRIMKEEETLSIEYMMVRKDETTFPAERSISVLRDSNGHPISFVCVVHDISQRKQMEASLLESEIKFRQIIESAPFGVHMYMLDAQEQLIFNGANPAADSLLGVDNNQFIGKKIEEAFPELIDTEIPKRYREAALNGTTWMTEQITYADKQISGAFEVEAFQTSYRNMAAFFHDIAERKRADDEIQNQRNFLERVINSLTHPFFVIDTNDYTIKMSNKAAMNNSLEQGMTCYEFSHGSDKPCREAGLVCPLDQIKITREPVVVEHSHIRDDGSDGIFQVFGYPIFDADGNLVEMIEYNLDVTDQRWAEHRLETESKRARLYLDVLAHDITNQLQVVLGNAELVEDLMLEKDVTAVPHLARQIEKSVQKCMKIISKAKSTDHLWMTPLIHRPILKVLFECIETLAERDDEFWLELNYEMTDEIVLADKYLEDLLTNFLGNALDHNPSNQKYVWINLSSTSDIYEISISDNGLGITNPMKQALFDPRQRVGGLSMHFSSEIVEKYGGSIEVHDRIQGNPEEGAMFKILLPKVRRESISEANRK